MRSRTRLTIMTAVLLAGAALWLPLLHSRRVAAQTTSLMGSYGFLVADYSNPQATQGVFTFDGAGNLTSNITNVRSDPSPNATTVLVQTVPVPGTYTVNSDGTGVIVLNVPGGLVINVAFVITDGGSNLILLSTGGTTGAANDVSSGFARKL